MEHDSVCHLVIQIEDLKSWISNFNQTYQVVPDAPCRQVSFVNLVSILYHIEVVYIVLSWWPWACAWTRAQSLCLLKFGAYSSFLVQKIEQHGGFTCTRTCLERRWLIEIIRQDWKLQVRACTRLSAHAGSCVGRQHWRLYALRPKNNVTMGLVPV